MKDDGLEILNIERCPRCDRIVDEEAVIDGVVYGWCRDCGDYT